MKENMSNEKHGIIIKMTYHSLEIILAKSLTREYKKIETPTKRFFGDDSHVPLIRIKETIVELESFCKV